MNNFPAKIKIILIGLSLSVLLVSLGIAFRRTTDVNLRTYKERAGGPGVQGGTPTAVEACTNQALNVKRLYIEGPSSVTVGQSFNVNVYVAPGTYFNGFDLVLGYDPAFFTAGGAPFTNIAGSRFTEVKNQNVTSLDPTTYYNRGNSTVSRLLVYSARQTNYGDFPDSGGSRWHMATLTLTPVPGAALNTVTKIVFVKGGTSSSDAVSLSRLACYNKDFVGEPGSSSFPDDLSLTIQLVDQTTIRGRLWINTDTSYSTRDLATEPLIMTGDLSLTDFRVEIDKGSGFTDIPLAANPIPDAVGNCPGCVKFGTTADKCVTDSCVNAYKIRIQVVNTTKNFVTAGYFVKYGQTAEDILWTSGDKAGDTAFVSSFLINDINWKDKNNVDIWFGMQKKDYALSLLPTDFSVIKGDTIGVPATLTVTPAGGWTGPADCTAAISDAPAGHGITVAPATFSVSSTAPAKTLTVKAGSADTCTGTGSKCTLTVTCGSKTDTSTFSLGTGPGTLQGKFWDGTNFYGAAAISTATVSYILGAGEPTSQTTADNTNVCGTPSVAVRGYSAPGLLKGTYRLKIVAPASYRISTSNTFYTNGISCSTAASSAPSWDGCSTVGGNNICYIKNVYVGVGDDGTTPDSSRNTINLLVGMEQTDYALSLLPTDFSVIKGDTIGVPATLTVTPAGGWTGPADCT
ncbi:MAG: hypothetical protein Q8N98_02635, partial [bacterium]|nr:hypothetical protein [bacterium]